MPGRPDVSRHHAKIRLDGQIATLEDLGSKNGTYVRGERLTAPYPLIDGDQIRLGSVLVTFRIPGSIETTDTVQS
jgi:pSer/pThr/pTyr-binding forkhead associated (FHA) protein